MHGQNIKNPYVNAYWIHEYSIDFEKIMTKLLSGEHLYITKCFFEPSKLKMIELKEILTKCNLDTTGKKAELIQRVQNNDCLNTLSVNLPDDAPRYYVLTPKGKEAVENLPRSMTKNLELEDECIYFISNNQLNKAYELICDNELKKISPRGLGMNWESERAKGLSDFRLKLYESFLKKDLKVSVPITINPYIPMLKASILLGLMLGTDESKIRFLFVRISGITNYSNKELTKLIQKLQFSLMDKIQQHSFSSLI